MMALLYWVIIFVVSVLCIVIAFKVFRISFGISPVLYHDVQELKDEKFLLIKLIIFTMVLFVIDLLIAITGGI